MHLMLQLIGGRGGLDLPFMGCPPEELLLGSRSCTFSAVFRLFPRCLSIADIFLLKCYGYA